MTVYTRNKQVDLSAYNFSFSMKNKLGRLLWKLCFWTLFRPFSLDLFKGWRNFILRLFGATIGQNSCVSASVKIWAPWNFELGHYSSIGPEVNCYNQGKIRIGNHTIVSQKTYLCASTHDCTISNFPLVLRPISVKDQVWIAADAFIAPGVVIETGCVVGARAAVFSRTAPWTIVGGNPARYIKDRKMSSSKEPKESFN